MERIILIKYGELTTKKANKIIKMENTFVIKCKICLLVKSMNK